MDPAEEQHLAWLARSFGRTDYLPLTSADLAALSDAGTYVEKYPGTHLFKEGADSEAAYVIQSGDVELFRERKNGRLIVGRVGPGAGGVGFEGVMVHDQIEHRVQVDAFGSVRDSGLTHGPPRIGPPLTRSPRQVVRGGGVAVFGWAFSQSARRSAEM